MKRWIRLSGLAVVVLLGACTESRSDDAKRAAAHHRALNVCTRARQDAWLVDPALCLIDYATNVGAPGGALSPRGIAFAPNGDLFVISGGHVLVLFDANGDGVSGAGERTVFGSIPGLNHGIAFSPDNNFVYVSVPTEVYRWSYSSGRRIAAEPPSIVVSGIAAGGSAGGGGHSTRTLLFDREGRLYVSIGSAGNLDTDPVDLATRSQIRRFAIPPQLPPAGIDFGSGEIVATGMRNEVGIAFDDAGRMWGVENGRDDLFDPRFGGDIHLDNPAERLNRIDGPGPTYFGYPQCWSEGTLPGGGGVGMQHADQEVPPGLRATEAWCQSVANVRPPAFALPAHWAPLGIVQYTGNLLPSAWRGDLFITSHGSWNREAGQVGRLVARAHLLPNGTVGSLEPVVGQLSSGGNLNQGSWSVRPVDIRQGPDGALYFSDDNSAGILRLGVGSPGGSDGGAPGDGGAPDQGRPRSSGCSAIADGQGALAWLALGWMLWTRSISRRIRA
jgi:glucose/arabinose dehydrogenase